MTILSCKCIKTKYRRFYEVGFSSIKICVKKFLKKGKKIKGASIDTPMQKCRKKFFLFALYLFYWLLYLKKSTYLHEITETPVFMRILTMQFAMQIHVDNVENEVKIILTQKIFNDKIILPPNPHRHRTTDTKSGSAISVCGESCVPY